MGRFDYDLDALRDLPDGTVVGIAARDRTRPDRVVDAALSGRANRLVVAPRQRRRGVT
jgi:hypothetical protein